MASWLDLVLSLSLLSDDRVNLLSMMRFFNHGWRSFFWLSTALAFFATLLVVICQPETKFHRTQGGSQLGNVSTRTAEKQINNNTAERGDAATPESSSDAPIAQTGKGRPSRGQFSLYQLPDRDWKNFVIRDITTPIKIFFNPIVLWAGLMLAGPADVLLIFNLTESLTFAAPPYLWSPGQVGYSNFGFAVGGIIGVVTAGPLSDWVAKRATQKNRGIREAEMRLPALIPYVTITIITHVIGGIAIQHRWSWQTIVVVGYGFSGLSVCSVPTIAIAYAIDCFKPVSGEIMVVATVLKNFLGFCLSYWVFDLATKATNGWITVFMVQFAVTMFPIVMTVPLYIWGKRLRIWYRYSSLHQMEEMI